MSWLGLSEFLLQVVAPLAAAVAAAGAIALSLEQITLAGRLRREIKFLREEAQVATSAVDRDLLWGMHKVALGKYMAIRAVPSPVTSLPSWRVGGMLALTIAMLCIPIFGNPDELTIITDARGFLYFLSIVSVISITCLLVMYDLLSVNYSRRAAFERFVQGKPLGPLPYKKPYDRLVHTEVPEYDIGEIIFWGFSVAFGVGLVVTSPLVAGVPWLGLWDKWYGDRPTGAGESAYLYVSSAMAVLGVLALTFGWTKLRESASRPWPDQLNIPDKTS